MKTNQDYWDIKNGKVPYSSFIASQVLMKRADNRKNKPSVFIPIESDKQTLLNELEKEYRSRPVENIPDMKKDSYFLDFGDPRHLPRSLTV